MSRPKKGITLRDRLEAKLKILPNGCWKWTGAQINVPKSLRKKNLRYGQIKVGNVTHLVHRASWLVYRGALPIGQKVCHKCDYTLCFNPQHLFLGTQQANVDDCISKSRHAYGEKHPKSILTDDTVRAIRAFYKPWDRKRSSTVTAKKFGISRTMVSLVINKKRWRHVTENESKSKS